MASLVSSGLRAFLMDFAAFMAAWYLGDFLMSIANSPWSDCRVIVTGWRRPLQAIETVSSSPPRGTLNTSYFAYHSDETIFSNIRLFVNNFLQFFYQPLVFRDDFLSVFNRPTLDDIVVLDCFNPFNANFADQCGSIVYDVP